MKMPRFWIYTNLADAMRFARSQSATGVVPKFYAGSDGDVRIYVVSA